MPLGTVCHLLQYKLCSFLIVLYLLEIREMVGVAYVILNHVSNTHPTTESEDSGEIVKQLRIIITSLKGMQFKDRGTVQYVWLTLFDSKQ